MPKGTSRLQLCSSNLILNTPDIKSPWIMFLKFLIAICILLSCHVLFRTGTWCDGLNVWPAKNFWLNVSSCMRLSYRYDLFCPSAFLVNAFDWICLKEKSKGLYPWLSPLGNCIYTSMHMSKNDKSSISQFFLHRFLLRQNVKYGSVN